MRFNPRWSLFPPIFAEQEPAAKARRPDQEGGIEREWPAEFLSGHGLLALNLSFCAYHFS